MKVKFVLIDRRVNPFRPAKPSVEIEFRAADAKTAWELLPQLVGISEEWEVRRLVEVKRLVENECPGKSDADNVGYCKNPFLK